MEPKQDPEILERFKAHLARRFFDPAVPAWQIESERAMVDLVEQGLILIAQKEQDFVVRLTEKGEAEGGGRLH